MPSICSAADLFSSQQQKACFLKALSKQDARYDPAEKMIRRPFSSPGYHTTLKGGYVHPPRDSLNYAVALLDSGEPDRLKRAQDILRKVISLQDQDPKSRTYGIWSWFMEEPLEKMSPPDWNWADFCGTQLLQVAHAVFGNYPIKTETGRDDSTAWLDVVLYNGAQKDINFAEISDAAVIFALSLNAQGEAPVFTNLSSRNINHQAPGRTTATWHNMSLTIPTKPMKTSEQRAAALAERKGQNLWKTETQ